MEFTVIDATVVRSAICQTASKLSKIRPSVAEDDQDGVDELIAKIKYMQSLDLSCSNILHIDNLCLLSPTKLTSLKLSVNRIDNICNLDSFTNLVELDLSHNHIKRIENLQGLVKLQRLILNHNPLTAVQNLDSQRDLLEILDLGYCKINNLKFTLYLKQFTKLVSLIVEGNPFRTEPVDSERTFIVSVIKSLLVYNNKTVTIDEKKVAFESYSELIVMLEKNDQKRKRLVEYERSRLKRLEIRKDSFIDRIPEDKDVDFNVSIFRNPTVDEVLEKNSRYGIHNVYRVYAEDFRRHVREITAAAESNREIRFLLIAEFHNKLRQLIDDGVDESRKCISEFAEYREQLEHNLSHRGLDERIKPDVEIPSERFILVEEVKQRSSSSKRPEIMHAQFDKRKRKLWLSLMTQEDSLSRKITEMIVELRDVLEKRIAEFKKLVNDRFCVLQRQQNVFLQFVLEYAISSTQSDNINNRFRNSSVFTNDITQCMESQTAQMECAELHIMKSASKWLDEMFNDLNCAEIQRNLRKISEIATCIRFEGKTFKQSLTI